jgi:hypothetical protein
MDPALRPHYQGSVRRLSLLLPLLFASSSPSLLLSLQTSPNLLLTSLLPQVWHEWVVDPYAKGTWAMYPPNFYNHYYHELQKPHGNVEWASSDFALSGWKGAYSSFFFDFARPEKADLPSQQALSTARSRREQGQRTCWSRSSGHVRRARARDFEVCPVGSRGNVFGSSGFSFCQPFCIIDFSAVPLS